MSEIYIGTSGYDYPEWKGVFYPPEIKRKDFLSYYATQFNALELNFCFYSMPTDERMLDFYHRSEGNLQFSVKANQLLTHKITKEWKNYAEDYKKAIIPLLEKDVLSSVLFQFPQSFHYIPENRFYLANIIEEFKDFPTVVEFRHKEWLRPSVFEGFEKRKISLAFCDMPNLKALPAMNAENNGEENIKILPGPMAYLRLHGRNENAWYCNDGEQNNNQNNDQHNQQNGSARYDYEYSEEELKSFVPIIKIITLEGKKTSVFFNNHPKGSGASNGQMLKRLLKENNL